MAKKGATRSPRYPAIGLEDAVEKVRKLYEADGTAGSPVDTAVKHMGYKSRSGPANTAIAALKRFGLVDSQSGRIVPTKRAVSILLLPNDDRKRAEQLQDAFMDADIYRELYERYKDTDFPSDETLHHDLILEDGFNSNSVKGFVRDLKESLVFCGLTDEDGGIRLTKYSGEDWLNTAPVPDEFDPLEAAKKRASKRTMMAGTKEDVYTLGAGDVVLQWPERLTNDEYEEINDWLELMRRKLKRSVVSEDVENSPDSD